MIFCLTDIYFFYLFNVLAMLQKCFDNIVEESAGLSEEATSELEDQAIPKSSSPKFYSHDKIQFWEPEI